MNPGQKAQSGPPYYNRPPSHQHGFMAQKGIQEPSILTTHLIQEANFNHKSLQLVSFDIEKAFVRVSHISIIPL
jgi:hypothetical protein